MSKIQGIEYKKVQTEYQYFPEEYFSGADVTVYFDDVWMDEITRLQFYLRENVMPIYGYQSYTFDAVARGNRVVHGSFAIAFKEAGYLYRVFDHIGQLREKARPALAYLAGNQEVPKWVAGPMENIESLLDRYDPELQDLKAEIKSEQKKGKDAATWPDMELGANVTNYPKLKDLQEIIVKNTFEDFYGNIGSDANYTEAEKAQAIRAQRYKGLTGPVKWNVKKGLYMGTKDKAAVKQLQIRLNGYLDWDPTYQKVTVNGNFGPDTKGAVKRFQERFSVSLGKDIQLLEREGKVGDLTVEYLNKPIQVSGWFDAATKLAILRFQAHHKIPLTGKFDTLTKQKMGLEEVLIKHRPSAAEKSYADEESKTWGREFAEDEKDRDTYWYSGGKQDWLKLEGFDIWINYGPLAEAVIQNQGKMPDKVNFNTTVKAIRNIQITGCTQVIGPDGTPIEEIYEFIAKDLD